MKRTKVYNPEKDNYKVKNLKILLEAKPIEGLAIMEARKLTGLSYITIKKYAKIWGYKIEKKAIMKSIMTSVIIKKEGDENGN